VNSIEEQIQEHKQSISKWAAEIGTKTELDLNQRTYYLIYQCKVCGNTTARSKEIKKEDWDQALTCDELLFNLEYHKIKPRRPCLCGSDGKTKAGVAELIEIRK
jgi:predicted  nucleic acid-binding Zn ribbon protein